MGDGTTSSRKSPTAVSAGYAHTCAVASTFRVYCWGHNTAGQLGFGNTTDQWTPVEVGTVTGAKAVAVGLTGYRAG